MPPNLSPLIRHLTRPTQFSSRTLIRTAYLQTANRLQSQQPTLIRRNSTQTQPPKQKQTQEPKEQNENEYETPPNRHRNWYKEFGRPVAKVFLMAVFTYQFIYFGWVKLDLDEVVAEREAEVKALEARLEQVTKEKERWKRD